MRTLTHTQVSVTLSVNVVTAREGSLYLLVMNIANLAGPVMLLWRVRLAYNRLRFCLKNAQKQMGESLAIAGKVLAIGFSSLAWGVGL